MRRAVLFVLGIIVFLGMTSTAEAQSTELVRNGGFEIGSGEDFWTFRGAIITRIARSGENAAALGILNNANHLIFQDIDIPPNANTVNLTFALNIDSDEGTANPNDLFGVEILDSDNNIVEIITAFSNRQKQNLGEYALRGPFDLSKFRGQTIRLGFECINDGSLPTSFRVDDVSLIAVLGPPGSFAITLNPSNTTVAPGRSASIAVTPIALGNFVGTVQLSAAIEPANSNVSFSFASNGIQVGTSTMLTVSVDPTGQTGSFNINIIGKAAGITKIGLAVIDIVSVGDFGLISTPSMQTIESGKSANFVINTQGSGGFSQSIQLGTEITPADGILSASYSTASVLPGSSSTLTVSTSPTARTGTVMINVVGTSGAFRRTTPIILNILGGPTISMAAYDGKKFLTIVGSRFGTIARVLINGTDQSIRIISATDTALMLKGKTKKLGLKSGNNMIQVIDAVGRTSEAFILKL